MKIAPNTRSFRTKAQYKGFTLIELLVVIAIIAVLAGLLFPAMGAVRTMARKTSAKNDVASIVNAIKLFYTEYGRYPTAESSAPTAQMILKGGKPGAAGDSNAALLGVLTLYNASGQAQQHANNPRQMRFLEVPRSKDQTAANAKSGLDSTGNWRDPWGQVYGIGIDYSYSGQLTGVTFPAGKSGTFPSTSVPTEVIAFSLGNPENTSTGGDPVLSFQ